MIRDRHVRERRQRRVGFHHHRSDLGLAGGRERVGCLRKGFRGWMCCGVYGLGARHGTVSFAVSNC